MKNLFLVLIFALPVSGQIKGNVQDPSGKGLPFVSVALLKSDSTVVKATATDEQ